MTNAEDLVGRRLQRVTTSWHQHRETEPSLLHMWLHLDGLGPVRFHTPGDGLSLDISQPYGPYEMDEYGHTTVEEDLPDFPMTRFIDQRILAVREIRYRDGSLDFATGLSVQFPNGSIRILNLADTVVVSRDDNLGRVEDHLHETTTWTTTNGPSHRSARTLNRKVVRTLRAAAFQIYFGVRSSNFDHSHLAPIAQLSQENAPSREAVQIGLPGHLATIAAAGMMSSTSNATSSSSSTSRSSRPVKS